jgi:hypothetical protein
VQAGVPSNLDLIRPSPCETRGAGSGTGPHGRDGGPVPVSHQTPLRRRCRLSTRRWRSAMSAPPAAISPDPAFNTPSAHPRRAMHRGRSSRLPVAGGPAPQRPLLSPSSMHTDTSSMRKSRVASFEVRMSSIRPLCAVDVGGVARTDCGRNAVAAPAPGRICGSTGRAWPNHAPRGGSDVPPAGREPSMAAPQGSRGFGHR